MMSAQTVNSTVHPTSKWRPVQMRMILSHSHRAEAIAAHRAYLIGCQITAAVMEACVGASVDRRNGVLFRKGVHVTISEQRTYQHTWLPVEYDTFRPYSIRLDA